MKKVLLPLFLALFVQSSLAQELAYDIRATYERPISIEQLLHAKTLSDLNPGYPSSWVSHYISVEVSTKQDGKLLSVVGKNDQLNEKQLELLQHATIGTEIIVNVQYDPKNTQQTEDFKQVHFSSTIIPAKEASFPRGNDQLMDYIQKETIQEIPLLLHQQLEQASIRFIIDKTGKANQIKVSKTSEFEEIDTLLMQAIQNMEAWIPAEDAEGNKVEQEFELVVGTMVGC